MCKVFTYREVKYVLTTLCLLLVGHLQGASVSFADYLTSGPIAEWINAPTTPVERNGGVRRAIVFHNPNGSPSHSLVGVSRLEVNSVPEVGGLRMVEHATKSEISLPSPFPGQQMRYGANLAEVINPGSSDNYIAVGFEGGVHIFNKSYFPSLSQSSTLTPITSIQAPLGSTNKFGENLLAHGQHLLVSDTQANLVYVYDASNWNAHTTVISPPTGVTAVEWGTSLEPLGELFGTNSEYVAIGDPYGSCAGVSASTDYEDGYLAVVDTTNWTIHSHLCAEANQGSGGIMPAFGTKFGISAARLPGNRLAIGGSNANFCPFPQQYGPSLCIDSNWTAQPVTSRTGAIYVYRWNGATFSLEQTIFPADIVNTSVSNDLVTGQDLEFGAALKSFEHSPSGSSTPTFYLATSAAGDLATGNDIGAEALLKVDYSGYPSSSAFTLAHVRKGSEIENSNGNPIGETIAEDSRYGEFNQVMSASGGMPYVYNFAAGVAGTTSASLSSLTYGTVDTFGSVSNPAHPPALGGSTLQSSCPGRMSVATGTLPALTGGLPATLSNRTPLKATISPPRLGGQRPIIKVKTVSAAGAPIILYACFGIQSSNPQPIFPLSPGSTLSYPGCSGCVYPIDMTAATTQCTTSRLANLVAPAPGRYTSQTSTMLAPTIPTWATPGGTWHGVIIQLEKSSTGMTFTVSGEIAATFGY